MLWNPDEIKSGQSTFIYLMYFWAGQPPLSEITFLQTEVKSLQEEETAVAPILYQVEATDTSPLLVSFSFLLLLCSNLALK